MDLTLHIIYIRGTVKYLLPLLDSHLGYTEESFTLVANGCHPEEVAQLQRAVARYPSRLTLEVLDGPGGVIRHGQAMEALLHRCPSRFIGFVDSDLIALGPYGHALREKLDGSAAVFSGFPYWTQPRDIVAKDFETGAYSWIGLAPNDHNLGVTYLAAYDASLLRKTLQRTGVSLGIQQWYSLPVGTRDQLSALGLRYCKYDTAKIANAFLGLDHPTEVYGSIDTFHVSSGSGIGAPLTLRRRLADGLPPTLSAGLSQLLYGLRGRPLPRVRRAGYSNALGLVARQALTSPIGQRLAANGRFQDLVAMIDIWGQDRRGELADWLEERIEHRSAVA